MSSRRSVVGTSTRLPASIVVKIGVMKTASIVETVVMVTDKATSARAKKEITFEAVPPGQQETRIKPVASGVGRSNKMARLHPSNGISVYWSAIPGRTIRRSEEILLKSTKPMVMPILSMITARPKVISGPLNHVTVSGHTTARQLVPITQAGNAFVSLVTIVTL